MSDTEIMVPLSELFCRKGRVSFEGGVLSKLTAKTESITFARDMDGQVIGLTIQSDSTSAHFALSRKQCEDFALTLAPWLKREDV